ncbi:MAG: DUF4332 domain-containing protein [Candidatus Thorarchaeota archaeon]|nr:DUF4332 domain-containing protein [Candidatus Thorarchaeota archaeon]
MEFEWDEVKKWTLWHYEDLIKRISQVFKYSFVQDNYNFSMKPARVHTAGLLNFGERKHAEYLVKITETLESLEKRGVRNYLYLVEEVETREKCERFVSTTKVPFRELIRCLNHIFRWVLPFTAPVKEFLDKDNEDHILTAKKLREFGIKNNLDLLEQGRTSDGRSKTSAQTGVSESFLLDLVNKADISRIPYIRGKTVKIFCNAGYDNLQKIADANLDTFADDLKGYLQTIGVKFSKSFIEPDGAIAQAKVLPVIVEQ